MFPFTCCHVVFSVFQNRKSFLNPLIDEQRGFRTKVPDERFDGTDPLRNTRLFSFCRTLLRVRFYHSYFEVQLNKGAISTHWISLVCVVQNFRTSPWNLVSRSMMLFSDLTTRLCTSWKKMGFNWRGYRELTKSQSTAPLVSIITLLFISKQSSTIKYFHLNWPKKEIAPSFPPAPPRNDNTFLTIQKYCTQQVQRNEALADQRGNFTCVRLSAQTGKGN